jgi:hypothetical protein
LNFEGVGLEKDNQNRVLAMLDTFSIADTDFSEHLLFGRGPGRESGSQVAGYVVAASS